MHLDRRHWLRAALAAALTCGPARGWSRSSHAEYPFALGVASGSPSHDSVVLWTRLGSGGLFSDAMGEAPVMVRWELATDENFRTIVRSGTSAAVALLGHAVHVEVTGLQPARWYWYRFASGDAVSATGRTRTMPAPGDTPASLRFAFASCQRWEHGWFAAWRHLLADDPELVVFLGDYIYEYAAPHGPVRRHSLTPAWTLADYRRRHALYKSDPDLQRIHQSCPWLMTWDDHEVQNDYADDRAEDLAPDFPTRRADAYQAWYEHMPMRASALRAGLAGLGERHAVRVHQRYRFGRLANFHVLDTRQFRHWQACARPGRGGQNNVSRAACPELTEPGRSMLGAAQERWLSDGLTDDVRDTVGWSVLAQQTLFAPRDLDPGPGESWWTDGWDGYPAARGRLLADIAARSPRNTVFIGGDVHQNWVTRLHARPERPDSPVVASEFCGTSISSRSGMPQTRADALVRANPHVLLADSERRGYQFVDLTPARWTTTLRVLDDATRIDSGAATLARFIVESGRPGPQRA